MDPKSQAAKDNAGDYGSIPQHDHEEGKKGGAPRVGGVSPFYIFKIPPLSHLSLIN